MVFNQLQDRKRNQIHCKLQLLLLQDAYHRQLSQNTDVDQSIGTCELLLHTAIDDLLQDGLNAQKLEAIAKVHQY